MHIDTCFDVSAYGIFRIEAGTDSYLEDLLGGGAKLEIEVVGSHNGKFFNYHVDNGDWAKGKISWGSKAKEDNCTHEFLPFDKAEDTEKDNNQENTEQNKDVSFGEVLLLSEFRGETGIGGKYSINITQLPTGYKLSDIVYESANNNIAKVDTSGVVEGVKGGITTVKVKTRDGKHSTIISIFVVEDSKIDFEGIKV